MTKYTVKYTTQFKKDYKLALKRGMKMELLNNVITDLANGVSLPEKNNDHALRRDLSRYVFAKECAIRIDKQQKERYNNAVIDNGIII